MRFAKRSQAAGPKKGSLAERFLLFSYHMQFKAFFAWKAGCGQAACRESTLVIELLEELLEAGFPEKTAIQMINTTLVCGREEIHYSTIDLTVFDLYTGECELIKAGASSTFIRRKDQIEHLTSTSLPIGVMNSLEIDSVKRQLTDGTYVIMLTDGVLDALPVGEQDFLLETIIKGTEIRYTYDNPVPFFYHMILSDKYLYFLLHLLPSIYRSQIPAVRIVMSSRTRPPVKSNT